MKSSLKLLVGLVSALSLVVGANYSASAQSSSVDSVGNQTPGNSNPSSIYRNPGDRPTNQNPSISPNPDAVIGPANGNPETPNRMGDNNTGNTDSTQTERTGTTPGTVNDPSDSQRPSSQSPNTPNRAGDNLDNTTGNDVNNPDRNRTERLGTTPGTTNDPSYNQQPGNQPFNNQQTPQSMTEGFDYSDSMSIDAIVSESPSFELLNALLRVANLEDEGLVAALGGEGSYVVYAPTDAAFAALPPDTIRTLVQPENRDLLVELLSYHIVPESDALNGVQASTEGETATNAEQSAAAVGEVDSPSQLSDSTSSLSTTPELSEFPRMRTDSASGSMMVNDARVVGANIQASNGTIVPIDRVILPAEVQTELGALGLTPNYGTPNAISPNNTNPNSPGLMNPSQRPF